MSEGHHRREAAIIDTIYAAALDQDRWREVLREVCCLLRGSEATLEVHDKAKGAVAYFAGHQVTDQQISDYVSYFSSVCPRVEHGRTENAGRVSFDYSFYDEPAIERDEFYQDFLRPAGLRYFIAGNLIANHELFSVVTIQRTAQVGHVDDADAQRLSRLLPHLQRAMGMSIALERAPLNTGTLNEMFSAAGVGAITLDRQARVLFQNPAAAWLLRQPGAPLEVDKRKLRAKDPREARALERAMAEACHNQGGVGTLVVGRGLMNHALTVSICPFPPPATLGSVVAASVGDYPTALVVFRLLAPRVALPVLLSLGLTRSEAVLAIGLAKGASLQEYAAQQRVSINTVRTHLARLRDKLQCRSQADVVRRVWQLLPCLDPSADPAFERS